jgi:hypothetical protein
MAKSVTEKDLKESILHLQARQTAEWRFLKDEFLSVSGSLTPANLIKKSIRDLTSASDIKGDILNTSLGLAAGYLSKKIVVGTSQHPMKKLVGEFIQAGVTTFVSKNNEGIKEVGACVLNAIFRKAKEQQPENIR